MAFKNNFIYTELIKKPVKRLLCALRRVNSGSNTFVSWNAELMNPRKISLGDDVVIEKSVRLLANGDSAKILIGDRTYIQPYVLMKAENGVISIGKDCTVNDFSILYGHGNLTIGNDVHIGAHTIIVPFNHIYQDPKVAIWKQGTTKKGLTIEDDVLIRASVTLLEGVTIGKGSVIGAGSVVTKSIAPYSVAVGVPATIVKKRT
jgi:acetyltransferase-like isoleucine patch superfamily enzyme